MADTGPPEHGDAHTTARSRILKRAFDVVVGTTLFLATLPVQSVIALVVLIAIGRPVLFRQIRPGQDGRPFNLIKFRTMHPASEGRQEGDRLSAVGRMLRSTSLDELPELWNVARGDMSLVGPRPLLMQYLDRYTSEQRRRMDVRPGLTGLAQVAGRNALDWEERLRLDVWYVDNWSLWLDVKILARTVITVLLRRGISAPGEATMPEFMGTSVDEPK